MKKFILFFVSISLFAPTYAKIEPVKGIEPSHTLPILYINTENSKEIDQKETYIDAEWWLQTFDIDGYESIGSQEKPQKLGIRGRGNTSWRHDGQKPYKLKLDKKTSLLGMGKNKHWALLAKIKRWELYNEILAFEIGRQLGMAFVPETRPVEVVLNGTYIGLYMLTETIRIDDNRLEIYEQPELNDNPATVGDGWLIEIDNNTEENQVAIPQPQGYDLRVTYHTPEMVNDLQKEWLRHQMEEITEAINTDNELQNSWEELVDIDALAKHLIVEECLYNYDAYKGSCYIYKDKGSKWTFGPLWDFSDSGYGRKKDLIAKREDQQWIGEFYKFPSFRKRLKEIWDSYYGNYGTEWIRPFLTEFYNKIEVAVKQSVKVWPDTPLNAEDGLEVVVASVTFDMEFNDLIFSTECDTKEITCELIDETADDLSDEMGQTNIPVVRLNGLNKRDATVNVGSTVYVSIEKNDNTEITRVMINGEKVEGFQTRHKPLRLKNIDKDLYIEIYYSTRMDDAGIMSPEISLTGEPEYYDLNGRKVNIDNSPKGIYIEVKGQERRKIMKK